MINFQIERFEKDPDRYVMKVYVEVDDEGKVDELEEAVMGWACDNFDCTKKKRKS